MKKNGWCQLIREFSLIRSNTVYYTYRTVNQESGIRNDFIGGQDIRIQVEN